MNYPFFKIRLNLNISNRFLISNSHLSIPIIKIANNCRFYTNYYNKIASDASKLCVNLDSNSIIDVLNDFISSRYNGYVLNKLLFKDSIEPKNESPIYKYLLFLQVCNKFNIKQLDLVSSISVNLSSLYFKISSQSSNCDFSQLKSITFAICKIYNELKLLYDPLFLLISNRFSNEIGNLNFDEITLLLRTFSQQKYNEPEIIRIICDHLENINLTKFDPSLAVSIYSSLAQMEYLSPNLKTKLETVFMEIGYNLHTFDNSLKSQAALDVAYSNLLLDTPTINDMQIVLSCLFRIANLYQSENLSTNFLRNFTVVVSYMKCLHKELYNTLDDETKSKIKSILLEFNEHKKLESTIFVEKVSEHLRRMRIGCDVNVYKNGVLLDILEKDQNLVWLCNSYHRFYATTFNMTANSKLLTKLIKSFGYKVAIVNYYQWGRMKCKRTRFTFLRMARYYALKDKREYDPKYSGWSLPYIWWNYSARDRLHISHYDHYNP